MTAATISDNALRILQERYLHNGESVEGMFRRVANGNEDHFRLMSELRFLPNSPTLFNAGLDNGCTLSACFVFDVADSMLEGPCSIHNTRGKAVAVAKAGGGVGYYFGNLRPRNAPIRTIQRKACGPVAVLRDYNAVAKLITQGGKRDLAQMGVLQCSHPDILEFIHAKDEDPQGLGSFNISVSWNDEWMARMMEMDPTVLPIWEEQVASAWAHGCPGMFFHDVVNKFNPNKHLGLIYSPNPCFTGDTRVWTIYGPRRFDELVSSEVPVLTQGDDDKLIFRMMRNVHKTRKGAKVWRVVTRAQRKKVIYGEFTATADHVVFLRDGTTKTVGDLLPGDKLSSVYRRKANQKGYKALANTAGDADMEHRIVMSWAHGSRPDYPAYHVDHIDEDKANNLPENLRVLTKEEHNGARMRGDRNPTVRFPEKNPFSKPGFYEKYKPSGFSGRHHSEESKKKTSESLRRRRKDNHEVVLVEYVGRQDVYDGTVDDTHRFFILTEDDGGVLVHNCGETPNRNDEPCNLGSLSLPRYFHAGNRDLDWAALERDAYLASEFLDDILDRNVFPHPDITAAALLTRKLGLGVMGWADLLALMHIHYDTPEAVDLGSRVMEAISEASHAASRDMAYKKGPYKGYSDKTEAECRRNETNTSIAPTGTIALIADVFGSIEPHFRLEWERTTKEGIKLQEKVSCWDQLEGFVPKTADQIAPEWHVRHQAAFQEFTDLGVSKTINLPFSATKEDVSRIYKQMYDSGCKGGTVFRDGCRDEQVLVGKTRSVFLMNGKELPRKKGLPSDRTSHTHKFRVDSTTGFLTVGLFDDGSPAEIFLRVSKIGSTVSGLLDTWAISFSIALQNGTPLVDLCEHHKGTRFEPCGMTGNKDIPVCTSIPDYVCRWLEARFAKVGPTELPSGQLCPECGSVAVYRAGCLVCTDVGCSWTKCG